MAFRIEDGQGNGSHAAVNSANELSVYARTISPQAYYSINHGQAFQAFSGVRQVVSPGAYGILALRNDSENLMMVTYLRIGVDKTETGQMQSEVRLDGTWNDGTLISPTNVNLGSAKDSGVVAHYNSTPTGATTIDNRWLSGPNEVTYNKEGSIILPRSHILSIRLTTETANAYVYGRISFVMVS